MKRTRRLSSLTLIGLLFVGLFGCSLFNHPPVASFTATPATGPVPLTVYFDGSDSVDPDGESLTYSWTFGDGATGTAVSGFHTYDEAGEFEVRLTVVDPYGETSTMLRTILVLEAENESPTAAFTAAPTTGAAPLTVAFNAAASSDDGAIAEYAWDFGDGGSATGVSVVHTYASQGAYLAMLTVTDDGGAEDSVSTVILVTEPGNQVPIASFTATPTIGFAPITVDFDASGSSDPDGSIVAFHWDFGDGDTGSGETVAHTYDTAGTYTIILTVIDDSGAPASDVHTVKVLVNLGPILPPVGPILPPVIFP